MEQGVLYVRSVRGRRRCALRPARERRSYDVRSNAQVARRPDAETSKGTLLRLPARFVVAVALTLVCAIASVVGPAVADTPNSANAPAVNASRPCVGLAGAPSRIKHVIVLFMENHPYNDIIGSPAAPYANGLARECGLATNYHNITHPSAPEYLAATSGGLDGIGDCPPVSLPGRPAACPDPNDNIFNQTLNAGETWKVYEESMACANYDVPLGTAQAGNLETDLTNGTLPNYAFMAPNVVDDTHDYPGLPGEVALGDNYLQQLIPTILNGLRRARTSSPDR